MSNSKYNNTLSCKQYYDRNRGNPEFRQRNALNTRRHYYKKNFPVLWEVFNVWKSLIMKEAIKAVAVKAFTKRLEESRDKKNKMLLKKVIDRWKLFEKTPEANIIYTNVVCSF